MEDRDIGQIGDLFTRYRQRFGMAPLMTLDEIRHQFLSGKGKGERTPGTWKERRDGQVVRAYVVEVRILNEREARPTLSVMFYRIHIRIRSQISSHFTPRHRPSLATRSIPFLKQRICTTTQLTLRFLLALKRTAG